MAYLSAVCQLMAYVVRKAYASGKDLRCETIASERKKEWDEPAEGPEVSCLPRVMSVILVKEGLSIY